MRPGPHYRVDLSADVEGFLARCARLGDADTSPFLAGPWLRAWYAALGSEAGRRPLLVGVRSAANGADLMLLPLVSQRRGVLSTVGFADASVIDYQLPVLAPDWAEGGPPVQCARRMWAALRRALRGHDVVRFEKMLAHGLAESVQVPNPLALALPTRGCEMYGNQMRIVGDFDAWRHTLDKRTRKELERCWRVFTRSPAARFERLTDPAQAVTVFEAMEQQQALRMRDASVRYVLDDAPYRRFYRTALLAGLADGSVVLTCLRDGAHLVAAQFGVANRSRYVALRLSTGGDAWSNCSPGRLLLERTAHHLHERGITWFDFGIGEYAHKAVFNVSRIPLFDTVQALSWRGLPALWAWRLGNGLKDQAWLVRGVRGVRRWRRGATQGARA